MTAKINILLIDTRVSHYEAIIAAVDPALSKGITFDYYTDTFDTLKERMGSSGVLANSVGLVQHNYKMPTFKMVDGQTTSSTIEQVEIQDNELSTWAPLKEFIEWCKTELSIEHFDMMACALYSNPDWKYVVDTLSTQTGVEIRASTDDTGSSSLGGNWFLESHVGINLKEVYFNDLIDGYVGLLDSAMFNSSVNNDFLYTTQIPTITTLPSRPTRPTNPTLPLPAPTLPSRPFLSGYTTSYGFYNEVQGNGGSVVSYGDDNNTNCSFSKVSTQLQNGVAYLFSSGAALKTNGNLVLWGNHMYSANIMVPSTANLSSGVCSMCRNGGYNICALKSDGSVVFWGNFSSGFPAFPSSDLSSGVNFVAASYEDFACLKSDGSIRGWGKEVFKNSSSVPALIYPAGSNLNSGFVKLVSVSYPNAFAAIKTDGSVVFFGGTSASTSYLSNPTTFYPAGSNITSGVVDVFMTIGVDSQSCFIALKSDGSLVAWGLGASSLSTWITGKTAVKIIKTTTRPMIILSDGTYINYLTTASEGTFTNIVDALESTQYNRYLFLRNDGTLAWRGNNNFYYYYSVGIEVFTNVVKMWNDPNGQFNQGAMVLTSTGELRNLINNTLMATDVNDAIVSLNYVTYVTNSGKVRVIKKVWNGGSQESVINNAPYPAIRANGAGQESATSLLATLNDGTVCTVLKTPITYPHLFVFNGNTYATCPYNQYSTALDLVTGYAGTSSSAGGNAFTIETWYYQPSQTLNSTIVDRGNSCYLFQVSPNANTITANLGCLGFSNTAISGSWLYATSAVVTSGGWTHIAMTREGTSYKFYINGVLKQTMTGPATLTRDDGVLGIGTQLGGTTTGGNYTNAGCSMYDLRLWNVRRTDDQIKSYMNVSVDPSSFGLVANYLLNDNENIFRDRTRNGFHCTIPIGNYVSTLWNTYIRNSKPDNSLFPSSIGVFLNPDYTLVRQSYLSLSLGTGPLTNLVKTDFTGANLTGINFTDKDLTGVNLSGANLTNVNFSNAILTGITVNKSTNFTGAVFANAVLYSVIGTVNPSLVPTNYLHYFSNVNLTNVLVDYNNVNTNAALPPTSITNYAVHFAEYYNYKKSNARFYISWATNSNALSFSSSSYTPKVRFQIINRDTNVVGVDVLFDYADGKGCIETNVPFYIDRGNEENSSVSDQSPANRNIPLRFMIWGELVNGVRSSSYAEIVTGSLPISSSTLFSLFSNILTTAPSWYTSITTNSNNSRYANYISYLNHSDNKLFLYGKQTFANGVISPAGAATFYDWSTNTPYIVPATSGAWRGYIIDPTGNSVFINVWASTSQGWCRYVFSTNTLTVLNTAESCNSTVCNSTGTRAYTNDINNLLVYDLTTNTASVVPLGVGNLRNMFIDKNDKYVVTSSYDAAAVYIIDIVNDANTKFSTGQIVSNATITSAFFDDSSTYCYAIFSTQNTNIYRIKLSDRTSSLFITLPIATSNITIINKYLYIFGINTSTQYSMIDTTDATPTVIVNSLPTGYDTVLQVYETKNKNVYCSVNYNGVPTIAHFTGFPNTFNNSSGIMLGPSMNYLNANLSNYNLSNKNFTGSKFTNATLTRADFTNSNLTTASFSGTVDYSTADLTGATLTGAIFSDEFFDYTLDANNNATVVKYRGGASLVFPEKVSGTYTITVIGANMDWGVSFTNFSFSATSKLVSIGVNAFYFRNMGIITSPFVGSKTFFPPTLTTIGYRGFYYAVLNPDRVTPGAGYQQLRITTDADIILPPSVNSIGNGAFSQFGPNCYVKVKPTLTWSSALTTPLATGSSTFTYTATSSGPIGYTGYNGSSPNSTKPVYYASSNTSIATINSSTGLVTLVGLGTVTFTANQDSESSSEVSFYSADTITSATLTVTKGTPILSAFSIASKYIGDAAFQVTAPTSTSTGAFYYTSDNESVATITDSGMITIVSVGSATITANQYATTNFNATAITTIFITLLKATPILSEFTIAPKYIGDSVFTLTAPTSIAYSYVKNTPEPYSKLTHFPRISTLTHWEISIHFRTTTSGRYQALISDRTGYSTNGWTFWLNPQGGVHVTSYSQGLYLDFLNGSVSPNKNYIATVRRTPSGLYVSVKDVGTGNTVSATGSSNLILTQDANVYVNFVSGSAVQATEGFVGTISSITVRDPRTTEVSDGLLRYAVKYTYANVFSSIAPGSAIMDSAMSLNGMYQTVTTYKNGFWLSSNYGANWSNTSPSSTAVGSVIYKAVSMSSSGQYQSVCEYNGYIYVSNDYGATWTKPATITGAKNFMAIKMTDSGLHQTCVADNDYIYTSSDSGATWTQKTSIGAKSYYDVAMSADGSIQYAVVLNGGGILKSTDKWATSTPVNTGLAQNKVGSIEVSSTGTYITIVSFTDTGVNDPVILSKDGGSTWTSFDPDGITRTGWTSSNVGMSADGRVQMLCYNTATLTGGLYFSIDYGTTWTNDVSINNDPRGVSVSRDGTYMLSGSNDLVMYNIFSDMATIPASKKVATIVELTGEVTIVGAGLVTVSASQDSTTNYNESAPISAKFLVNKVTPVLSNVTILKPYSDAAFQVTAPEGSSASNGIMRYAFLSGDTTVASITELGLITVNKVGTVLFSASQYETSSYFAPTPVTVTLTVSKATPILSNVTVSKTFGDAAFQVTAPEGSSVSGGTMYYVFSSGDTTVASITDTGLITVHNAGTVVFSASQDFTTNYNSPLPVSVMLTVNKAIPTLSGFTIPPKTYTYGTDTTFQVTATTSSGSNGTFRYSSNNSAVASIDSLGTVTINGAGSATFSVNQDSTDNYDAPVPLTAILTVIKATPTIAISNLSKTTVDTTFTFPTSSASDGARTFSSNTPGVATIDSSSGLVTIVGIVGTTTITVSQAETTNYDAPSDATATLTVTKGKPILSDFSIESKIFGDLPFAVTAPASQNTVGTFHYTSNTPGVATIDSGTITIVGAGSTTITANQDATTNFNAPTPITATLTVAKATPTIVVSNITKSSIDPIFTFARSTASDGALTFSSSSESVATVNSVSGVVTVVSAGTATITVSQVATNNYNAPTNATATLTVTAGTFTNAIIPSGSDLSGKNLSGASLVGATLANVVLSNSNLNGADFSGANVTGTDFTNASIVGATNLPTFSTKQKLELLYNANNAGANISQLQFSAPLSVSELNAALSVPIPELLSVNTEFLVAAPVYDVSNVKIVTIAQSSISCVNNTSFYIPLNKGETELKKLRIIMG